MSTASHTHKIYDSLVCSLERTARVARLSAYRFFDENPNIEVTFNEFLIIEALFNTPKIHQGDLARVLSRGAANLSRDLEKLENRGIINRSLSTKDKRIVKTLMLTNEGEKIYNDVMNQTFYHLESIEKIFNEQEYLQFSQYLDRLNQKLAESCGYTFEASK